MKRIVKLKLERGKDNCSPRTNTVRALILALKFYHIGQHLGGRGAITVREALEIGFAFNSPLKSENLCVKS